jgi:hypothetical protein
LEAEHALKNDDFSGSGHPQNPSFGVKYGTEVFSDSSALTNVLANSAIGLTTGYIFKKILFGKSTNPVKLALGLFIQFALANLVAQNAEIIKSKSATLINLFFRKKDS